MDFSSFLTYYAKNKTNVRSLRVEPPRLGSPGFGSIEVRLKRPVYGKR